MDDNYKPNNWTSRTFWLCVAIIGLGTALNALGNLDGAGWVTTSLAVLAAWQGRKAYDFKMVTETEQYKAEIASRTEGGGEE